MMRDETLEKLWFGKIIPYEQFNADNEKLNSIRISAMQYYDKLSSTLTTEQKDLLSKYEEMQDKAISLSEKNSFTCGFKLGVRIIIESMEKT